MQISTTKPQVPHPIEETKRPPAQAHVPQKKPTFTTEKDPKPQPKEAIDPLKPTAEERRISALRKVHLDKCQLVPEFAEGKGLIFDNCPIALHSELDDEQIPYDAQRLRNGTHKFLFHNGQDAYHAYKLAELYYARERKKFQVKAIKF